MSKVVVFAYHAVGVRGLKALLALGLDIQCIVTHPDDAAETVWFDSVAQLGRDYNIPTLFSDSVTEQDLIERLQHLQPDFIFSFYYRQMLSQRVLDCAARGAYNLHGSLLPKYRGRAPVNWAILHGEAETGVTLHAMTAKPDAGHVVDQVAVPILPDDTAHEVFSKIVVAAEQCLLCAVPRLVNGTAVLHPQNLAEGHYFGGRTAADGRFRLDWSAQRIHNLVRAVTRPYPGAFIDTPHGRLTIWKTRALPGELPVELPQRDTLMVQNGQPCLQPSGGGLLLILDADLNGQALTATSAVLPMVLT